MWTIFSSPTGASGLAGRDRNNFRDNRLDRLNDRFRSLGQDGRLESSKSGGSTDLSFGSVPDDSERFDRVSPISETVSGFGGRSFRHRLDARCRNKIDWRLFSFADRRNSRSQGGSSFGQRLSS